MNKIKIREYMPEDKPRLMEIFKLHVPAYFATTEINDLDNYLDHEIETYFVAEANGKIVGAGGINLDINNKTGKISWDFIDPSFQGRGIGQELLNKRIKLLKSTEGIEIIEVRTSQLAYKFYEKNRFIIKEIIKDYWAEGLDLYRMNLSK